MKKDLRASTLKKSSESNLRRQKPVIKRKRLEESDKLLKSVESNQNILQEEINRLSKISVDSSSDNDSIVSLEWDSQHDIESPPKEELDLISVTRKQFAASPDLSTNPARKRSVSVSVNRATFVSTESGEVDLHPVNRSLDHQFLQDTLLERNLQNRREKELGLIIEEHSSRQITMDENVYQEHILNLKRKYAKTIREIEKYTVKTIHWAAKEIDQERLNETNNAVKKFVDEVKKVRSQLDRKLDKERFDAVNKFRLDIKRMHVDNEAEIKRRFSKPEASRSEPDKIETKKQIQPNSILKEKSSETPVKVEKAKVDVSKVEALVEEKAEVDVPKVEALVVKKVNDVDDIDVGECLMKAADLCCQEQDDVKSSVLSNDKVDESEVEKSNQDWNYRHSMWWLNFRRKVIYDKIRSKKQSKSVKRNLKVYKNGIHEFIDEFKDVEGCDIRGWKKRLSITQKDVRSYVNKPKSNCKVQSRCTVSSRNSLDVMKPDATSYSVDYPKIPADDAGMKSRRRMLKAKMVTVSTQTDVDEIAKMSTQVDSISSQVVSKPCWCRSAKILDMQLFRKAVYVDQDQGKEAMLAQNVAT